MRRAGWIAVLAGLAFAPALVRAAEDPVALVDPLVGTGGVSAVVGTIDDFPGAAVPFGMMAWSPDTPTQPPAGGYSYHDSAITGFSLTHLSGAGCQIYGDFSVQPSVGAVSDPTNVRQRFSHGDETASPGYYAVTLGATPIRVQLTVTPRTGLGAFTFPATQQAQLLVNVASDQAGVTNAEFRVAGPDEIAGSATSGSFCGMPNSFTVYFVARFNRPFTAHGTWNGTNVTPRSDRAQGTAVGGYLTFDTTRDPSVEMQTALSYVSIDGAKRNLAAEATTWDVDGARARATATWRRVLGEIRVTGNTLPERRMFYTSLYHALLEPSIVSDADGSYLGFDDRVHRDVPGHDEYSNFSGWDTYRTVMPLQALLVPKAASDMIASLVHVAQQGGWLPKWPVANGYTGVMAGDAADPLIAGAYAFGARDFDTRAALAAMIKGATDTTSAPGQGWYIERPNLSEYLAHGYVTNIHTNSVSPVPNGASETLEYSLDDFAIGAFARALGDDADYRRFTLRSANWEHLFNTATGLIAPRGPDGTFMHTPLTPNGQSGFQEGNAWQYTWMVPQSASVLVDALGGPAATVAKLDAFFSSSNVGPSYPYAWFGNEPTLGSNFVYLWAGAPYREQLVTQTMLTTLYSATPDGIPGNDDLGTMSAGWAWLSMGLYPVNVSMRNLALGTPLFSHVSIHTPNGPRVEISAPQAANDVPYIESLRVNGKAVDKSWTPLPERGILRLDYTLGRTPNLAWAASPKDAPPTYVTDAHEFPPATAATLDLPPTDITLAPGERATLAFTLDNTIGAAPVTATWNATTPSGVGVEPASGTLEAGAYDRRAATASVSVAAMQPSGLYDVIVAGIAANGARLARQTAIVRVARPNERTNFAFVANFSDNTVTPIDLRTGFFGSAIPVDKNPGDLALSADGSRLYTANQGSADLSVIDTTTLHATGTIAVGKTPAGIRIAPDGVIWVTNYGDNTVVAVDAAQHVSAPIPVGTQPEGLAISPDGEEVYVVNQGSNSVTPVSARSHAAQTPIPVGRRPQDAVVSRDGKRLYVDNTTDATVSVVDLASRNVIATIPVGKIPQGMSISSDGAWLYVANSASNTVTPIDLRTNSAAAAIPVGNGPFDVHFGSDGKTALVSDTGDNECVVIDVASKTVTARIATGSFPIAVTSP